MSGILVRSGYILMNKTDTALCSHKLIKKIDSKKKIIQILTILQTVKNATKS